MSVNLQKIGTVLLNMDDVAQELNIKGVRRYDDEASNEYFSPLIARDELEHAGEVSNAHPEYLKIKQVAGIPVKQIAISEEGDQHTVKNSLQLGGKNADEYFLAEEGAATGHNITKIRTDYHDEIADLRDELIQLRAELARKGLVDNIKPYAGFYDTFRENYPLHQHTIIATCYRDSSVQNQMRVRDDEIDNFSIGDYVIVKTDNDTSDNGTAFLRIQDIVGTTLIFNAYTGFPIKAEKCHVYRSYGMAYKNTFSFGSSSTNRASNREIYTCLDDDNYRTRKKIAAPHTGWATTFRITPMKADGANEYYLSNVEIVVKKFGSPGDLKCYIINALDVDNWINPQQATEDGILLAESQPLTVESRASESVVQFDFAEDGQYPLLQNIDMEDNGTAKTRFCMIVEAIEADKDNYYEVLCLQHYDPATNSVGDLQLNNILYQYTALDVRTSTTVALKTSDAINNSDLYYGVTLRPVIGGAYNSFSKGLYSAEFKTFEPIRCNKARVTLRVAREGMFSVSRTSADSTNDLRSNGTVTVTEDKSYRTTAESGSTVNPFAIFQTHPFVIGTNICDINEVSGFTLRLNKGCHVEAGDPVYPVGYSITIRALNRIWDETQQRTVQDGASVKFTMNLTQVQPAYTTEEVSARDLILASTAENTSEILRSRLREKNIVSDRLIWEADIRNASGLSPTGEPLSGQELQDALERKYNTFYVQVYWETSADQSLESFSGRIYNLTVSLDRKAFE